MFKGERERAKCSEKQEGDVVYIPYPQSLEIKGREGR